jgi:hypothetical protein
MMMNFNQPTTMPDRSIDPRFPYEAVKFIGFFVALVPVLFVFTSISLGFMNPAYDWIRNTISELIWGQHGWVLTIEFCVFGTSMIILALRLGVNFAIGVKSKLGLSLMVLIGIGFLIIAVFPTRAPGAPQTITGLIHMNTVRVMAMLFPASCLLFGAGIRKGTETSIIRIQSLSAGIVGLLITVPGAVATLTDASWLGAIERIILLNGIMWIEVITISVTFPGIIRRLNRRIWPGYFTEANSQVVLAEMATDIK